MTREEQIRQASIEYTYKDRPMCIGGGAYEEKYYGEHIPCPTISEALKWLREEKKIAINVEFMPHVWQYKIFDMSFEERFEPCGKTFYENYEEAALAGLEYVLDNLI